MAKDAFGTLREDGSNNAALWNSLTPEEKEGYKTRHVAYMMRELAYKEGNGEAPDRKDFNLWIDHPGLRFY